MKGISFDAESVRAFPRKTQTRRVIDLKVSSRESIHDAHSICMDGEGDWIAWFGHRLSSDYAAFTLENYRKGGGFKCPYGKPGDRLYVRERLIRWDQDGTAPLALYDAGRDVVGGRTGGHAWIWKRAALPACFMPRHLSRFTLELLDVRVERVQKISNADARAEGVREWGGDEPGDYIGSYRERWNALNAGRGFGWDANPWVWALTFRVIA